MNDVVESREEAKQRLERKTDWRHEDHMERLALIGKQLWWVQVWMFAIFLSVALSGGGK